MANTTIGKEENRGIITKWLVLKMMMIGYLLTY